MTAKAAVVAAILQVTGKPAGGVEEVRADLLAAVIVEESDIWGFDPLLTVAIIDEESHFDPNLRSAAGAIGLMGILRGGAVPVELADRNDATLALPRQNIALGLSHLSWIRSRHPKSGVKCWLSRYNAGGARCRSSSYAERVWSRWQRLKKINATPQRPGIESLASQ